MRAIIMVKRMENLMFQVVFFADENGISEVETFLNELSHSAITSKDARVQLKQLVYYIDLLQNNGTRLPESITKHITEDIWELRPGDNRVFYFFFRNNTFVLLHHFRKKSQKTPQREIETAKRKRDQFLTLERKKQK